MASGKLKPATALIAAAAIVLVALPASWFVHPLLTLLLALYAGLNLAYSLRLKHVVIIDVMIIAAGFVLRAIAGGVAIRVPLTPWFLVCAMLLSLFLAIGKRRHELLLLEEGRGTHRKVLDSYSVPLLDQMIGIVTTATIISYSLFTFTSGRTIHLMWTIPFVVYGIFRYLYLIHICNKGGAPDRVLFEDRPILITVLLYGLSAGIILLVFEN